MGARPQLQGGNGVRSSASKQAGAAILYMLVLSVAVATAFVALVSLTGQTGFTASRLEHSAEVQSSFQGALTQIRSDLSRGALVVPSTQAITVGRVTSSVTVSNNAVNQPRTYRVDQTASFLGRSYTASKIIAQPVSVYDFGMAINATTDLNSWIDIYNAGGLYVNGNLNVWQNNSSVAGDMVLAGLKGGTRTIAVAGTTYTSAMPAAFPVFNAIDYFNAANVRLTGPTTINGYTFTTPYTLIYVNGDATITGTFKGNGTIFVNGNVTVSGGSYADSLSHFAVITNGIIAPDPGLTRTVGMYITSNQVDNTSPPRLINDRGFYVIGAVSVSRGFSITFDSWIKDDPRNAVNMKLPGFWP